MLQCFYIKAYAPIIYFDEINSKYFLARVLVFSDDTDVSGEIILKVECHTRGEFLLELLGFHPDLCQGGKFQMLTSYLITVK